MSSSPTSFNQEDSRRIARLAVHLEGLGIDTLANDYVGELDVLHASTLEAVLYGLDLMFQDVIDDLDVLKRATLDIPTLLIHHQYWSM